jgi:hypothetical protein
MAASIKLRLALTAFPAKIAYLRGTLPQSISGFGHCSFQEKQAGQTLNSQQFIGLVPKCYVLLFYG